MTSDSLPNEESRLFILDAVTAARDCMRNARDHLVAIQYSGELRPFIPDDATSDFGACFWHMGDIINTLSRAILAKSDAERPGTTHDQR